MFKEGGRSSVMIVLTLALGCSVSPDDAPSGEGTGSRNGQMRVTPYTVARKHLVRHIEQPGQVTALETTPLYGQVSGYVRKVHVDLGDTVRGPVAQEKEQTQPGQILIELDVPELEQELAQKSAAVQQIEAEIIQAQVAVKVAEAKREAAGALVEETRASIDRAQADYERWEAELARITALAARDAVTTKLVDETKSRTRAADAARKEVAAKIKSSESHEREAGAFAEKATADLQAARAKLAVAQADRERMRTQLDFATIRAPFDGRVAARHVDVGHLVSAGGAGTPLLVIVNTKIVRVYVDVPERDAADLPPDAVATIRIPALTGEIQGKVARTSWVIQEPTRTLRAGIDLANDDDRIRPGMYAHIRLKVAERPDALVVPKTALMLSGGQSSCWRLAPDGTIRRQSLQTGIESGGEIEVVTGLDENDRIIGVNPGAFREGQVVEIATAPSP